jgi:hypothetical protein
MRITGPSGPTAPQEPEGQTYQTKQGDTLNSIASQFNVSPDALRSHNKLTDPVDKQLVAGLKLDIPSPGPVESRPKIGIAQSTDTVEDISAARFQPFENIADKVGVGWGETYPPSDPYGDPKWTEVEPAWMQKESQPGLDKINPGIIGKKLSE